METTMILNDKTVMVIGGSRGLGLGLVEVLAERGAKVVAVARSAGDLEAARARLGVKTITTDITDRAAADRIVADVRPDVLILNAGAIPGADAIHQISWEAFSAPWETDVKGGLFWLQAALNLPLAPGSRILVGSSGAAVQGSPMSGGYAGAKRMLWLMAKYANDVSRQKRLGLRFQAIVPMQIVGGTGVGEAGAAAYARAQGVDPEVVLARFGAPLPPPLWRACGAGSHRAAVRCRTRPWPEGRQRDYRAGGDGGLSQADATGGVDPAAFLSLAAELRSELHRYCARLTGSVIDGEDVVQDSIAKGLAALDMLEAATPMRAWLFRIAHNRALDLLRSRAIRAAEPIEAAAETADVETPDPLEVLMRQEAVDMAISRFVELPPPQRSVIVLKDVLDHSLEDIADLLGLTVNAVKAHLARGRARLKAINAQVRPLPAARPASAATARYALLFNRRDGDGLRDLLADDVRLNQATHAPRAGAADVGRFFGFYETFVPVRLEPAWLEGREVLAAFEVGSVEPDYFMWLEWRGEEIVFIHDYRHARYVGEGAELVLAANAPHAPEVHARPRPSHNG
jgi:RNA polymerase sigma-70 factor (ECF subfamily)